MDGYNVTDIINKAIIITNKKKAMYEGIAEKNSHIPAIEIITKVLTKEILRTIKYYEELKSEIGFEDIDFSIYDKMSYLIDEFNKETHVKEISSAKEYLKFSLELEKNGKAVLIDVQGRFVKSESDINTKTYRILSDMINNKEKLISTLEKIIK